MKKHMFIIAILFLFLKNIVSYAQSEIIVTYSRTNAKWGIDDTQTLFYKDGKAKFLFYQKPTKKKIDFYEVDLPHKKYINYYIIDTKRSIEQTILEDETLLSSEWQSNLNWIISEETKEINGYKVQKATAESHHDFKEEDQYSCGKVTAWFSTDIPIPIGPHRFHGLPGLIIKLEYERYNPTFLVQSIDFKTPVTIDIPEKHGIIVTKEQAIRPNTINTKWLEEQKGQNSKKDKKSWWQVWN